MHALRIALVIALVACSIASAPLRAQALDDVLTTAWEASWRQLGYPRSVSRWQGPLRVAFKGVEVERLKGHAFQQLKTVAEVAGLDISEAEESAANVRVEFVDERGLKFEGQH